MKNMKDLEAALMSEAPKSKPTDVEHKAKAEVLKELMDYCKNMLADQCGGDMEEMKKVTVMAKDEESLKDGLKKAEDVVASMPEMEDMMEDPSKEMSKEDIKEDVTEGEDPMDEEDHKPLFPGFKKKMKV